MPLYLSQLLTQLFVLLNIVLLVILCIMLDAIIKLKKKQKGANDGFIRGVTNTAYTQITDTKN